MLLVILIYIIGSLDMYFALKALKFKEPAVAFVPIYGSYTLLKEYQGRVYVRNWGKIYLLIFGIFLSVVILSPIFESHIGRTATNRGNIIVVIFAVMSLLIMGTIHFLLRYPIFVTLEKKTVFYWVFTVFCIADIVLNYSDSNIETYRTKIFVVAFIFQIIVLLLFIMFTYDFYKKVKSDEIILFDKIKSNQLNINDKKEEIDNRNYSLGSQI